MNKTLRLIIMISAVACEVLIPTLVHGEPQTEIPAGLG